MVLVFRDASKDRNAQEILRKTEKLAAAARLAATVAHEINNPLEAVGNLVYLAKATPGVPPAGGRATCSSPNRNWIVSPTSPGRRSASIANRAPSTR